MTVTETHNTVGAPHGPVRSPNRANTTTCWIEMPEPCRGGLVKQLPIRCPRPEHDDRELPLAARVSSPVLSSPVLSDSPSRLLAAAGALIVSVLVAAVLGSGLWGATSSPASTDYVVQPGDTVFSVANALADEQHGAREVAEWLTETRLGAPLRVGERISRG